MRSKLSGYSYWIGGGRNWMIVRSSYLAVNSVLRLYLLLYTSSNKCEGLRNTVLTISWKQYGIVNFLKLEIER